MWYQMAVVYVMGTHASGISILFPIDVVSVDGLFNPIDVQSNLFIMDTKGTGITVRIIEVSILGK